MINFLKKVFNQNKIDLKLIGEWKSDQSNELTKTSIGDVRIIFTEKGRLTYTIKQAVKDQIILMTYEAVNGKIISDQPSMPGKEESTYWFDDLDTLILEHEGMQTRFTKLS